MLDSAMYFFWNDGMMDQTVLDDDATGGWLLATVYRLTDCKDGKIVYFVASDAMRVALFNALGHPEWGEDPRFSSMEALADQANFEAMGQMVADRFAELTVEEALEGLLANEVPCGPILSAEDAINDVQAVHNGTVQKFEHPEAGLIQGAHPAARAVPGVSRLR